MYVLILDILALSRPLCCLKGHDTYMRVRTLMRYTHNAMNQSDPCLIRELFFDNFDHSSKAPDMKALGHFLRTALNSTTVVP